MFIRTAIAVLSAATIIQTGTAMAQTAPQQGAPPAFTAPAQGHSHHKRMALFRGLNLSADQKAQIKGIRQKYHTQNRNVTDPQQRRANMQAQRQEIMRVLTPDQQQKVQQRIAAMRSRRHEHPSPNGVNPPAQ